MVTKWVWDIDEKICINVLKINSFEITKYENPDTLYFILYARLDYLIKIAESPDIGILKDKIRTIIAGD